MVRVSRRRWLPPAVEYLAISGVCLALAPSLQAQTESVILTVQDLSNICESALDFADKTPEERTPQEAVQMVRCFGYVEGVVSAVIRLSVSGFMTDPLYEGTFCFPESTEPRNWIASFVAWTDGHPDKLEAPAVDGFLLALIENYPCSESPEPGIE